jgi:hypothetical protein
LPRNRAIGALPDTALTLLGLARLLRDGNRAEMAEAATLTQDAASSRRHSAPTGPRSWLSGTSHEHGGLLNQAERPRCKSPFTA